MEYIQVTRENIEKEHICCAISNNKDVQVSSKSFKEVINESDVSKAWDEKFEKIENAKNVFLSMDVLKK